MKVVFRSICQIAAHRSRVIGLQVTSLHMGNGWVTGQNPVYLQLSCFGLNKAFETPQKRFVSSFLPSLTFLCTFLQGLWPFSAGKKTGQSMFATILQRVFHKSPELQIDVLKNQKTVESMRNKNRKGVL